MNLDVITDNPMLAVIVVVDSPERTEQLWTWLLRLTTVLIIWFVGWPLWASMAQSVRGGGPDEPTY